ncbi:MFS transporter [Candidatus Oscillochloris fontis]|uniref:MFS transporter n=1 Tax=Candidatus Oscillochloris fontis TaxID=2496868 RepID=UPI00101C1098|nr:MFS transporter [Candidatus Oscillochloris fontis]
MATSTLKTTPNLSLLQILVLLLGRFTFNTGFRVIYPLLPLLANGLQVSLSMVSLLVTVQVGATMLSPLGGMLADRFGERRSMLIGLGIFIFGAAICALASSFMPFMLGYTLIGIATALYMSPAQAYASARSAYTERARILGLLELSWAASALLGVAALTQLIAWQASWTPAFVVLGIAALLTFGLTIILLSPGTLQPHTRTTTTTGGLTLLRRSDILAALGMMFFQLLAAELIFVIYATWLERDFAASTEQIGLIFGLLGIVELGGALTATLFTDRIGKRRAVLIGFAGVAIFQALLPLSSGHWLLFLALFLLFDLCFEFAIVSAFPLMSGLTEHGRGTVLALMVAMMGLGRVVGSLAGPALFLTIGIWGNGLLAAAGAIIGVLLCFWLVPEGHA